MACDASLPELGCCGGGIVPAREVRNTHVAALWFVAFSDSVNSWSFYKTREVKAVYLADPQYVSHATGYVVPRARRTTFVEEPDHKIFPGFFSEPPQGWEVSPGFNGGFVGSRKFRPNGSGPSDPWWYEMTVTHRDPYTEEEAMAEFMALFNAGKVLTPSLCANFGVNGFYSYDQNGDIKEGLGSILQNRLLCNGNASSRPRPGLNPGGQGGFTKLVYGMPQPTSFRDDMGNYGQGTFTGAKALVRMDRSACIWRYQVETAFGQPQSANPPCPGPSCAFLQLPTEDVPGCTTLWPRYVEFALLPDGVDPETEEGEPVPDVWYAYAGCTGCF
jgi:hypothetical protein